MFSRFLYVFLLFISFLHASQVSLEEDPYNRYYVARNLQQFDKAAELAMQVIERDRSGYFLNDIYENDQRLGEVLKDLQIPRAQRLGALKAYLQREYGDS